MLYDGFLLSTSLKFAWLVDKWFRCSKHAKSDTSRGELLDGLTKIYWTLCTINAQNLLTTKCHGIQGMTHYVLFVKTNTV